MEVLKAFKEEFLKQYMKNIKVMGVFLEKSLHTFAKKSLEKFLKNFLKDICKKTLKNNFYMKIRMIDLRSMWINF